MKDTNLRQAARAFAENWKGRGYEKGDSQKLVAEEEEVYN